MATPSSPGQHTTAASWQGRPGPLNPRGSEHQPALPAGKGRPKRRYPMPPDSLEMPLLEGVLPYPQGGQWATLPVAVSVLLLGQALLRDALGRQLSQDIVQVVDVRVAVAGEVGAKLCLVVDLVPYHRVRLACGARRPDGKNQAPVPGHKQQLQYLGRGR